MEGGIQKTPLLTDPGNTGYTGYVKYWYEITGTVSKGCKTDFRFGKFLPPYGFSSFSSFCIQMPG